MQICPLCWYGECRNWASACIYYFLSLNLSSPWIFWASFPACEPHLPQAQADASVPNTHTKPSGLFSRSDRLCLPPWGGAAASWPTGCGSDDVTLKRWRSSIGTLRFSIKWTTMRFNPKRIKSSTIRLSQFHTHTAGVIYISVVLHYNNNNNNKIAFLGFCLSLNASFGLIREQSNNWHRCLKPNLLTILFSKW